MSLAQNERHQSVVNEAVRQTPGTVNMWNGLRNLLDYYTRMLTLENTIVVIMLEYVYNI